MAEPEDVLISAHTFLKVLVKSQPEGSYKRKGVYPNLRAAVAFPKMLAGLFSYPKRHFYLSVNNRLNFPVSRKFSSFSSHFNPKIVGNNRSSELDIHRDDLLGAPGT